MKKHTDKQTMTLEQTIKDSNKSVIMVELPTKAYFDTNADNIQTLIRNGFEGVYISFQRPFKNVFGLFNEKGIDTSKLVIIDAVSACEGAPEKNTNCILISEKSSVDETVRAIYTALSRLQSTKVFILIDSLTTIALYMPLSEIMRFCEFLMGTVAKQEGKRAVLIFGVAKDLAQKKFIQDIALRVDETILQENGMPND